MSEEQEIQKLNQNIIKNTKRIKNLRIRDDIIGFFPSVLLSSAVTGVYIKCYDVFLIKDLYLISILTSFIIGSIPSAYLPTKRTKRKIEKYQNEIKISLDKLHEYAIEEDKKIFQKK